MELLAYLKRQRLLLVLLAGIAAVFAAVFSLYDLPLEAVGYGALLCLVLGAVLFILGFRRFRSRHRELRQLLDETGVTYLSNTFVPLERNGDTITLAGIDDPNG